MTPHAHAPIAPFISAQRVILLAPAPGQPRDLLRELIGVLAAEELVTDPELFLGDVERREAQVTTVMDNGVAFPHARSHAVRRLGLSLAIVAEPGLRFDPESEVRSRLFFCLAVPSLAPTAHIPLLQALARFARDPKRVEKLLSSRTPGTAARYLAAFKG